MANRLLFQAPIYTRLTAQLSSTDIYNVTRVNREARQLLTCALFWESVPCDVKQAFFKYAALNGKTQFATVLLDSGIAAIDRTIALQHVVERGYSDIAKKILMVGIDPSIQPYWNPFYTILNRNDIEMAKVILDFNVYPNYHRHNYYLCVAIELERVEIIKMFIEHKHYDSHNSTNQAARYGKIELLRLFLDAGFIFEPNILNHAVESRSLEVLKFILATNFTPEQAYLNVALRKSLEWGGIPEIIQYLLDLGADPSLFTPELLRESARWNRCGGVSVLLDRGIRVEYSMIANILQEYIIYYKNSENIQMLEEFLKRDIYTHQIRSIILNNSANHRILLYESIRQGLYTIAKILLEIHPMTNIDADWGLKTAIKSGDACLVELLLDHGADIRADKDQAIILAKQCNHPAVINILVSRGANYLAAKLRKEFMRENTVGVKILLGMGAPTTAITDEDIQYIALAGNVKLVNLICNSD